MAPCLLGAGRWLGHGRGNRNETDTGEHDRKETPGNPRSSGNPAELLEPDGRVITHGHAIEHVARLRSPVSGEHGVAAERLCAQNPRRGNRGRERPFIPRNLNGPDLSGEMRFLGGLINLEAK